jgi:hypothetical protein
MENKILIEDTIHSAARFSKDVLKNKYPSFFEQHLDVKIDYSPRRRTHRGGIYANGPAINIAAYLFKDLHKSQVIRFYEYPSYDADPIIGGCFASPENFIYLTVGHEVAHACQFFEKRRQKLENVTPHGVLFKNIYKDIRLELNKLLVPQEWSTKEYSNLITFIRKKEFSNASV